MLKGDHRNTAKENLRYKYVVEGANLFFTHDARLAAERSGVYLIVDSTANKGGVTSSSIEVFTGLALSDAEHTANMAATHDGPKFYKDMVKEICTRVEFNARREFELIWSEWEKDKTQTMTEISDKLSKKIVEIRSAILSSRALFDDKDFMRYVLTKYSPTTLQSLVPAEVIMQRVPVKYQEAICAMWLASDYVYTQGIHASEFDFFQYMRKHLKGKKQL